MKWLLTFCAIILFIGVANLPIEYYTFLRLIVFVGAIAVIVTEYEKGLNLWMVLFGITAILFNPIVPIYLHNKETWAILDILGGLLFLAKLLAPKKQK